MSDASLYSVRQLADSLGLPESTVRYYRDTYASYLSVVGTGPRRLYPPETLEHLRTIKRGYADGLTRADIERQLQNHSRNGHEEPATNGATPTPGTNVAQYDSVLATILDGERERREAMWQVAREIVRLGEVVERQQVLLGAIAQEVGAGDHLLPSNGGTPAHEKTSDPIPFAESATIDGTVAAELTTLREQLERERELVERLRRSKVDMERRAAEAEALLEAHGTDDTGTRGPSILKRLLRRDTDT